MTLFFSLLPLYLFGNFHCLGMCGPLVLLIGQHTYKYYYLAGRIASFSLAGMIAGEIGAVLHVILKQYHLAEAATFLFGGIILLIGIEHLTGIPLLSFRKLSPLFAKLNQYVSPLMLKDSPWAIFLFGFATVLLPCGQTLVVFSACALAGDLYVGLFNGFAFALLTSPSLLFAMHSSILIKKCNRYYRQVLGVSSLVIGSLALCRGFAEAGWISHLVLNPDAPTHYHIVIY